MCLILCYVMWEIGVRLANFIKPPSGKIRNVNGFKHRPGIHYIFVCSCVCRWTYICMYVYNYNNWGHCVKWFVNSYTFSINMYLIISHFLRVTCVNVLIVYWSIAHFAFAKLGMQYYFTLICDCHNNYKLILTLTSNCNETSSSVQTNNALKDRTTLLDHCLLIVTHTHSAMA